MDNNLSENNEVLVSTVIKIATSIVRQQTDDYTTNLISSNYTNIGMSIVNNVLTDKLDRLINTTDDISMLTSKVKPKFNTWLSLIDINKTRKIDTTYGFSVGDIDTINILKGRLNKEINGYRNNDLVKMKSLTYKINEYIKLNSNNHTTIDNKMFFNRFKTCDFKDLMDDKGMFDTLDIVNDTDGGTIEGTVVGKTIEFKDLELTTVIQDELDSRADGADIIVKANALLHTSTLADFKAYLDITEVIDINHLYLVLAALYNEYKLNIGDARTRDVYSRFINELNTTISALEANLNINVIGDSVLHGINYDNGLYQIYVNTKIYDEYIKNGGSSDVIRGYIYEHATVSTLEQLRMYMSMNVNKKQLLEQRALYMDTYDHVIKSLILASKNNTVNVLKQYYIIAMDDVIPENEIIKFTAPVHNLLSEMSLSKLMNVENTIEMLFRKVFSKDNNFNILLDGISDAKEFVGDRYDIKDYVGYAIYRMIIIYLIDQTEFVVK